MLSRALFPLLSTAGLVCSMAPPSAHAHPDVPTRWTFRLVARAGGQPIGFPAFTLIQDFNPALDQDGSAAVRYQLPTGTREGLLIYDAATDQTRTIAERAPWFTIGVEEGFDFTAGRLAFSNPLSGTIEVWSKEGALIHTIQPGGPELVAPTFAFTTLRPDGAIAYVSTRQDNSATQLIIESFDLPTRHQLRVADSGPNSTYSGFGGVTASNAGLHFAARVILRPSGAAQIRRWSGSPLPVSPTIVADAGVFSDRLATNDSGQVVFWRDTPQSTGYELVRASSLADAQIMASSPALGAFAQDFRPSINAEGLVVFGDGSNSTGHNVLSITNGAAQAVIASSGGAIHTQLGSFFLSVNPAFPGSPEINDQRQVVFLARLVDQSICLFVASPFSCDADFNKNEFLDPDDLGDFINAYFALPPDPRTDFNADSVIDPDDLGDYINAYFLGCDD